MHRVPLVAALLLLFAASAARGEVREVRIAWQFGVAYLPLMVVKNRRLIEEHAEKAGVAPLKVSWTTFSSGADMNTALLASALDLASGGIGPVLNIWSRTQGNLNVKGVAALGSLPLYLNTINPAVRSVRDFTEKDKIALPAVKVSNADKLAATKIYIEEEKSKLALDFVHKVVSDPDVSFTVAPQGFMRFADFMSKTGALKTKPASWRDVFFQEIHPEPGS